MSKKKLLVSALIASLTFFSFSLTALADTTDNSSNIFTNSGFEEEVDGLPTGWNTNIWDTDNSVLIGAASDIVRSGLKSVYINNSEENDSRFYQTVSVEADSYYKISAYVYAENITGGDIGANIGFENSTVHSDSVFNTDGKWQQIVLYGKTSEDQTNLAVSLRLGGYSSTVTGEAWFDDVSIEKVYSVPDGVTVADLSNTYSTTNESGQSTTERAENVSDLDLYVTFIFVGLMGALIFYYFYNKTAKREKLSLEPKDEVLKAGSALILAFFIRCLIAVMYGTRGNDMTTFMYWANALATKGLGSFYTGGFFADYPPGYMYVLYIVGSILNFFSVDMSSPVFSLVTKCPAILCDIALAIMVYKIARKKFSANISYLLLLGVAFNPAMIFNSAGWGQIDSILTLLVCVSLYYLYKKDLIKSLIVYAIAVLVKPQALLFGPVIAMFIIFYFIRSEKEQRAKLIKNFILGIFAALAVFMLLIIPFNGTQKFGWILSKYLSTTTQYDYATINAANLFGLLGANWVPSSNVFLFMSFKMWGISFISLVSIALIIYIIKFKPESKHIFLIAAVYTFSVFMLGHYMHERYYYPVIVLLVLAFINTKDKRLLHMFVLLSTTLIISQGQAMGLYPAIPSTDVVYLATSAINVYALGWLIYLTYDITIKKNIVSFDDYVESIPETEDNGDINLLNEDEPKGKLNWTKKDTKIILALTIVYAIIAFMNLGNMTSPQTYWRSRDVGDEVVLKLNSSTHIDKFTYFANICDGNVDILYSTDGRIFDKAATVDIQEGEMYKWNTVDLNINATYIKLKTVSASVWLNEIGFYNGDTPIENIQVVSQSVKTPYEGSDAKNLIDEQSELSLYKTNMNGFYFDEIYHARTAYEHLHFLEVYEISHPPLGKELIAVGIAIFGMTPFGWRFSGTLFGVLMVPLLYVFAKRLFDGKSRYAFIATFLFTFDFMHFTQTRIATIDVYGVFFIIAMYYYMYKYYVMSYNTSSLKKTFLPLLLCGIMFGLGSAGKWIDIYAGGGLAIIFFVSLHHRYLEYKYAKQGLTTFNTDGLETGLSLIQKARFEEIVDTFKNKTIKTILFCIPAFIIIPLVIYYLSFIPYMINVEDPYTLNRVLWDAQVFMFSYHSGLTAGHPYSSQWYEWPFMIRPVWYYKGEGQAEGMYSTIAAFGNPAVWYSALVGTVYGILSYALDWIKREKVLFFLIVAFASQYLPWVLITRATFLYHYFASVPFIILILVYIIRKMEQRHKKFKYVTYALLALTAILFVVFYPALSGLSVNENYIAFLRWLPSWWF